MDSADYETMNESARLQGFESWTPVQLSQYITQQGLGDYSEVIIHHKITGKLVPLVTDADLKDMGIQLVGDRLRFRQVMLGLSRKARAQQRNQIRWTGEERLFFNGCDWCCSTCFGLCPADPSVYTLTNNYLRLKTVLPARCGPVVLPCCHEYKLNNIDLTHVQDVDVIGIPSPCLLRTFCCAPGKDRVEITASAAETGSDDGKFSLIVKAGEGEIVSSKIMNQVEESQQMERD